LPTSKNRAAWKTAGRSRSWQTDEALMPRPAGPRRAATPRQAGSDRRREGREAPQAEPTLPEDLSREEPVEPGRDREEVVAARNPAQALQRCQHEQRRKEGALEETAGGNHENRSPPQT